MSDFGCILSSKKKAPAFSVTLNQRRGNKEPCTLSVPKETEEGCVRNIGCREMERMEAGIQHFLQRSKWLRKYKVNLGTCCARK